MAMAMCTITDLVIRKWKSLPSQSLCVIRYPLSCCSSISSMNSANYLTNMSSYQHQPVLNTHQYPLQYVQTALAIDSVPYPSRHVSLFNTQPHFLLYNSTVDGLLSGAKLQRDVDNWLKFTTHHLGTHTQKALYTE